MSDATAKKLDANTLSPAQRPLKAAGEPKRYTTISDLEVPPLVTPDMLKPGLEERLGQPGEFPYTRGVHESMYRGKVWTMRQFAGFGTAKETNARYHHLLASGQTGLSVAFHLPTLMGVDSDDPRSKGEVGKCGVAMDSIKDMEMLFSGIPMEKVSTSMTTNAPAVIVWAFYLAAAKRQGAKLENLRGTIQNDILKEYIAQKTWIFPPRPAMRLIRDTIAFGTKHVPQWNTISISGYHIREAGATAAQELAFTLADGLEYVKLGLEAGLHVDDFAPRLSFFFNSHSDFFEEIGKFRAARRIWSRELQRRFGAKKAESLKLRFHTQTAGVSLTAQQPVNNVVRVALQALAAVMGGTQSLHTNSLDETLALPTQEAATIALRTQQIIAEETGVASTADPLGGSYFVEWMTDKMEEEAMAYINKIDELGGMLAAVENGFPQQEIVKAAKRYQEQYDKGEKIMVGANKFISDDDRPVEVLRITPEMERNQIESLRQLRASRSNDTVRQKLDALRRVCEDPKANVMPTVLEAVEAHTTLGEMVGAMKEVFGEYRDPGMY